MDLLEEQLERKMDQKIEFLTKDFRQMLKDHFNGESVNQQPHHEWNQVFPRGRTGGRGSQGGRGLLAGFNEGIHPHTPHFFHQYTPPS